MIVVTKMLDTLLRAYIRSEAVDVPGVRVTLRHMLIVTEISHLWEVDEVVWAWEPVRTLSFMGRVRFFRVGRFVFVIGVVVVERGIILAG